MMVSLVLGIISVLLSLNGILGISLMGVIHGMTFTMWGAPITGIAGIIAGIITKNKGGQSDNKKFAVAGLLCSIVGLILSIVMFIVIYKIFGTWEVS